MLIRNRILATAALLPALLFVIPARAQSTPQTINYQGRITDNTPQQNPVNGPIAMTFAIYNVASGGTLLWSESADVGVVNGVFSRQLGSTNPIPASVFTGAAVPRYLQITLNTGGTPEILSPRQVISATPFAMRLDGLGTPSGANSSGSGGTGTNCSLASVLLFAENFMPNDYVPCDGRLLLISANTALFSLIGTIYGGNGSTNFAVPDLRTVTPDNMMYGICQYGIFPSR